MKSDLIIKNELVLKPNPSRFLIRFFSPNTPERITRVIARIMAQDDKRIEQELQHILNQFANRHLHVKRIFLKHYEYVSTNMVTDIEPSIERKLLIGAYFTSEYALESSALFNPSIVPHPDQSGLKKGELRFIMSLRAIGEGHTSSIVFRSGIIDNDLNIKLNLPGNLVIGPRIIHNPTYEKNYFAIKLYEMGFENEYSIKILDKIGENFTFEELKIQIDKVKLDYPRRIPSLLETEMAMISLAEANHEVKFEKDQDISERVIYPYAPNEQKGIEDARFVHFNNEDNGKNNYYATYTAYDGHTILPQLMETENFIHFKFITLNGKAVQNKGMALFPRKINGNYAMLGRQDNENIYIMYSNNIHFWHDTELVMKPSYTWEYVQVGNCGSPIELDEGWLVLTHGVGAMRRYCIGTILLDKDDPSRIIGRLDQPLIEPDENFRQGYVPNVVYTCGAIVHQNQLILPYSMSDYATTFAFVDIKRLLERMN